MRLTAVSIAGILLIDGRALAASGADPNGPGGRDGLSRAAYVAATDCWVL